MGRKCKSPTITGKRIPIELYQEARTIQAYYNKRGRKLSLQDAMRHVIYSYRRIKW